MPALEEGFVAAMKLPGGGERQEMGYEQFDDFLSTVKTSQVRKCTEQETKNHRAFSMLSGCLSNAGLDASLRLSEKVTG